MKSAYELALERMEQASGPTRKLSDEEKTRISDIEKKYDAQAAEIRLSYEAKIAGAAPAERPGLQEELRVELARIESRREQAKEEIWQGGKG